MKNIEAPYSEEEHNLGKEIVKKNKVIDRRIKEIFNELKNEIKQFNAYKSRNNLYENPYHSVQVMDGMFLDRKSTRLNSSHVAISYAVFCLKKKKQKKIQTTNN